jgi:diguanylate cyclase (GGDEF)-like protein
MFFKAAAFFITLALLMLYDYFPQRSLSLHPQQTQYIQESVDSDLGGNSKLNWLNKSDFHWTCELNAGAPYPYCGASIAWSDAPFKQLDLSGFSHIEIALEYSGKAQYIRAFLRNYYPIADTQDIIAAAKFNSVSIPANNFTQLVKIPLQDLRVADWWIENNQIPPFDVKPDVRKVIAFGIDMPYPNTLGTHKFRLDSVRAVGAFFSKESLYLGIILFWATLLIIEMFAQQMKLRSKIRLDEEHLQELKVKSANYQEKAEHDQLTGILNREGLTRIIDELQSTQLLKQYSLLVLDLDLFKHINDKFGHVVGDTVIKDTATILTQNIRSYDMCARWGGEEFVILFHCLDSNNIQPYAEKIRRSIESSQFADGKIGKVTLSIGATTLLQDETFEQAFARADKALYKAKGNGRNTTALILSQSNKLD